MLRGKIQKAKKFAVGDIVATPYGNCEILEYKDKLNITIMFTSTGYRRTCTAHSLRTGGVKDNMIPSVYGVGIIGDGDYKVYFEGTTTKEYRVWRGVIQRCYCPKFKQSNPAYASATMNSEMLNFQVFAEWCNNQIGFGLPGWHLDKDVLGGQSKHYSFENCAFIPAELNAMLTKRTARRGPYKIGVSPNTGKFKAIMSDGRGNSVWLGNFYTEDEAFLAYKEGKEAFIKRQADMYKEQIDPRVYEALYKYKVNEND